MAGTVEKPRMGSLVLVHWLSKAVMVQFGPQIWARPLRGHRNEVAGGGSAAAKATRVIPRPKYNQTTGISIGLELPADASNCISRPFGDQFVYWGNNLRVQFWQRSRGNTTGTQARSYQERNQP